MSCNLLSNCKVISDAKRDRYDAAAERTPNQEESTSLCSESHVNRAETPDALSIRYTAQRQRERVIVTRSITRRPCPRAQQLCCDLIPAP
jgi:hypothetical protein